MDLINKMKYILILFMSLTFSNSFASSSNSNYDIVCNPDNLEAKEVCEINNPATRYLSLRKLDSSNMKNVDTLNELDRRRLEAQTLYHNSSRDNIDEKHKKLGELIFSSFFIIIILIISLNGSFAEYLRVGTQTKGIDGIIISSFFVICLACAMDARNGGYVARDIRDNVEIALEGIRQELTNQTIDNLKDQSLIDLDANIEAIANLEEGINFEIALGRFMFDTQMSFYRMAVVESENNIDKVFETDADFFANLKPLTAENIFSKDKTVGIDEEILYKNVFDIYTKSGDFVRTMTAVEYQNVTYTELSGMTVKVKKEKVIMPQRLPFQYTSSIQIKDDKDRTYGTINFKEVDIPNEFIRDNVDIPNFILNVKAGGDYLTAARSAMSSLMATLESEGGGYTQKNQDILIQTAFTLAEIKKAEMTLITIKQMIPSINENVFTAIDAFCLNQHDLAKGADVLIEKRGSAPKTLSCLKAYNGEISVLGKDESGALYDSKTTQSQIKAYEDVLKTRLVAALNSIESIYAYQYDDLYKEFIELQNEIKNTETVDDYYKVRGGALFGEYLSNKVIKTGFNYVLELQNELNLVSNSDEYYLNFRDQSELTQLAPDLAQSLNYYIGKRYINDITNNAVDYQKNTRFKYEDVVNSQISNELNTNLKVSTEAEGGAFSMLIPIWDGLGAITHYKDGGAYNTQLEAFVDTIGNAKELAVNSIDTVFYTYIALSIAQRTLEPKNTKKGKNNVIAAGNNIDQSGLGSSAPSVGMNNAKKSKVGEYANSAFKYGAVIAKWLLYLLSFIILITVMLSKIVIEAPNLIFGFFSISILVANIQIMIMPYIMGFYAFVGFSKKEKIEQMKLVGLFFIMGFMFVTGSFLVVAFGVLLYNPMVILIGYGSELIVSSLSGSTNEWIGVALGSLLTLLCSIGYLLFILRFFWRIVANIIAEVPQFDNSVDIFKQIEKDVNAITKIEQGAFQIALLNKDSVFANLEHIEERLRDKSSDLVAPIFNAKDKMMEIKDKQPSKNRSNGETEEPVKKEDLSKE